MSRPKCHRSVIYRLNLSLQFYYCFTIAAYHNTQQVCVYLQPFSRQMSQ